jgi:LacI family transcriptional regulator
MGGKETEGAELFSSRKQVFISMMTERGSYNPASVYECDNNQNWVEQGYQMMKAWIGLKRSLPTAIFCANDPVALGVLKAILEAGLSVPDDISLITHDGAFPTQYSFPALTTVDVHPYQLGIEGVKLLRERIIEGRKMAKKVFLHPELVIRNSVKNLTHSSAAKRKSY